MRKSTALLLLATAVLAAATIWLWRDREQALAQVASLQAAGGTVPVTDADASMADTDAAVVPMANVAEPAETGDAPPPKKDYGEFERRLLQDPIYREARRNFRELELMAGHLELAKALGVTPEKAKQLIALLVEQEFRYLEERDLNPRSEEEIRARQLRNEQAVRENDTELVALLGGAKFAEWKEYQASLQVRHEVRQFGASLFAHGAPLRDDQIEPLISAIQAERARARQALSEFTESLAWSGGAEAKSHRYRDEREIELGEDANRRVHAAASAILSKPQLAALDDYLQRQLELQDAQRRMHEAQGEWIRINGGGG